MNSVSKQYSEPKIAIVHDDLARSGGAERLVSFICNIFPQAPVYTSVYFPDKTYTIFQKRRVYTLPGAQYVRTEKRFKQLFLLWIIGFRYLNLSDYDIVLSSTTFGAKHVRPGPNVLHACYCHAPFRLLWNPQSYSQSSIPMPAGAYKLTAGLRLVLRYIDKASMQPIPKIATNSQNTANQIKNIYNRQAEVIHPPIRVADYEISKERGDYFLSVGRLISHKRVDLAIKACNRLKKKLIVVGDGPELQSLQRLAGDTIYFAGLVPDTELRSLYQHSQALLFPSYEDYGIVPLEAQASGIPVIAYGNGGALETIREDETGIFFAEQDEESLVDAICQFERRTFDPLKIRNHASQFDVGIFESKIKQFVTSSL